MPTKVYGGATFLVDFTADVEITGTPVSNRRLIASASGNTTIVTTTASQVIKLYKSLLSVESDITGEVQLLIGSTVVGGVRNPRAGSQYVLTSAFPDYELGAANEDLIVSLPSAVAVTLNCCYEVV